MFSYDLLSHSLQPTRVTDHSATIIDNIFTNATKYDTISGNILTLNRLGFLESSTAGGGGRILPPLCNFLI